MANGVARVLGLALLIAACGHGSEKYSGDPPPADQVYGQCAFCHAGLATEMVAHGGHGGLEVKCTSCHDDLTPGMVGCGHRSLPRCLDCHTAQITHHDPAVAAPQQCTHCHTPHGSPNLLLIRPEVVLTDGANTVVPCEVGGDCGDGQVCATGDAACGVATKTVGCAAPIDFTSLRGRADGSFASASNPGTGLCEACHTTTRYYRRDGGGEPHFDLPCYPCHEHTVGFLP